jgi:hypothetical protein
MAGTNQICSDPAYINMINQKQRFQLLNIPPSRYDNLVNTPYTKRNPITGSLFTKNDLDMRRKVEILKYSANNSSSQTNRFTKAEIYRQAVSGKYQQRTYSNTYITENTENNQLNHCPIIQTPSSACNIPGPIIYLYEDDNVPLYNYINNNDANYGILTQGLNPYGKTWDYTRTTNKNVVSNATIFTTIASLFVLYQDVPIKTFSITTPISIKISGKTTSTAALSIQNITSIINISGISSNILYSNKIVNSSIPITYTYTIPNTIIVTVNKENSANFTGYCYLGLLTITNITLPIQKGYIYDIQCNIEYSNTTNNYIDTIGFETTFNVSFSTIPIPSKCSITGGTTWPNPFVFPNITMTSL